MTKLLLPELSTSILNAANRVHRHLGHGLPEICYREALLIEFKRRGLKAVKECRHKVYYEGEMVGFFRSDIIVEGQIILELKSVKAIHDEHHAQLLNYLRLTQLRVGYVLNFGALSMQFKRLVL